MKILKHWLLFGIVLLGFGLRFWQLGQIPVILNRDEAALAYNSLLLKETGQDEWGAHWPLALASFGDYKLIGYPATLVGVFTFLGYSDFAVKFPSALAGMALIVLAYLWIKKLTPWGQRAALLVSLLIAIQPVFFFYSRIAFEANLALSLFVASLLIYLTNSPSRRRDLIASICLGAAVLTYNTPLLLLPFLIPVIVCWRGWRQPRRLMPAVVGMLAVLIMGGATLFSLSQQKSGITIFSDEDTWFAFVSQHQQLSGWQQKILGNKYVFYGQIMAKNYLATISPVFLVERGGAHPWHSLPGWGHLYWISYIFGWAGLIGIFAKWLVIILGRQWQKFLQTDQKINLLLIYFLVISPLPAIITVDAPHATRSLFFFFIWLCISVYGFLLINRLLRQFIQNKKIITIFYSLVFAALTIESANYFWHYFRNYPAESNAILRDHFGVVQQIARDQTVKKVAVVDDGGYQYILTAWYLKMRPDLFFATIQKHLPDKIGFRYGYKLGQFRFIAQEADRFADEKTLIEWDALTQSWIRKDF